MSINMTIITGNLAADPKKRGKAENPVLNFTVGVNDRVKNGDKWEDKANFIDCVIFGNRAKALGTILKKGMKVCVEGKLSQSHWQDKTSGATVYKIEVIANDVELMTKVETKAEQSGESW